MSQGADDLVKKLHHLYFKITEESETSSITNNFQLAILFYSEVNTEEHSASMLSTLHLKLNLSDS